MDTLHLSRNEMLDVLTFFTVRAALEAVAPQTITDQRTLYPSPRDGLVAYPPLANDEEGAV